jgi:Arc/MetJ-type ribon-helix-helix transcriptional regulator
MRMSEQIAVRIPDTLAKSLDDLVSEGRFETKAEAIRAALQTLVDQERRRKVGELIADGYRRIPQDEDELEAARRAAIRSIEQEPW